MLNVFNRVIAIFVLISVVLCAMLNAIGVWVLPLMPEASAQWRIWLTSVAPATFAPTPQFQAIVSGVALIVIFVASLLLILELRPGGGADLIPVAKAEGGETRLKSDAVVQRLRHEIDLIQDVVEVKPRVHRKGDGIEVHLDVRTGPEVDVPMKDNEIKQVARQVVEAQMGLTLKRLSVRLDHAPFPQPPRQ